MFHVSVCNIIFIGLKDIVKVQAHGITFNYTPASNAKEAPPRLKECVPYLCRVRSAPGKPGKLGLFLKI